MLWGFALQQSQKSVLLCVHSQSHAPRTRIKVCHHNVKRIFPFLSNIVESIHMTKIDIEICVCRELRSDLLTSPPLINRGVQLMWVSTVLSNQDIYSPLLSRDDDSCCSTWARVSCDASEDRVFWASRRAGISARCCRNCCHTSSEEGAEGFRTRRSVVKVQKVEVFHSTRQCCASHTGVADGSGSRIGTKKLDLKSNCATHTPYIVLQVSHN